MSDLATRLRNIKAGGAYSRVRYEAADRIEALERENERFRATLDRIASGHGSPACDAGGYYEDIAKEALA